MDIGDSRARAWSWAIVYGLDPDQDRTGVNDIHIRSKIVGQHARWTDLRLSSQAIESRWIHSGDRERNGLRGKFIDRRAWPWLDASKEPTQW